MVEFFQLLGALGVVELIKYFIDRSDKKKSYATKDDVSTVKNGLMAICQTMLEEKMQYYLNIGEITDNQFKALTTLGNAYESLGGNDFIHTLFEQCKELYEQCKLSR